MNPKPLPWTLTVALGLLVACASVASSDESTAYGRLLAKHVRPGTVEGIRANLVNYAAVATDPNYAQALNELENASPGALATKEEAFAFWVNAYNLLAIKTIVDRYPIASIREAGTLFSPIWKKEVGTIGGKPYSLDAVEHGKLRMDWKEPRVHLALVCASLSCPDLRAEPYVAARLDAQLDDQARSFLANETKGMALGATGTTARVSSIFKWFRDDFAPAGGVVAFIKAKADPALAPRVAELTDAGLSYLQYDWSLNDTPPDAR